MFELPTFSPSPAPKIAQAFGQAASHYSTHALAQKHCAEMLWSWFDQQLSEGQATKGQNSKELEKSHTPPQGNRLPPGPILELGCGTGFLTRGLLERFAGQRSLEITDISPAMVAQCQQELNKTFQSSGSSIVPLRDARFYALDAEAMTQEAAYSPARSSAYALITSSFALQWFEHPEQTLRSCLRQLIPSGWLLFAFPSDRSFPQWHRQCEQLGLPKPGNPLPCPAPLINQLKSHSQICRVQECWLPMQFPSAIAFLQHFKAIGARTPVNCPSLSPGQLRQLIRAWNRNSPDGVRVDYHVIFVAVQV